VVFFFWGKRKEERRRKKRKKDRRKEGKREGGREGEGGGRGGEREMQDLFPILLYTQISLLCVLTTVGSDYL